MALPVLFANNTNPTGPELDLNFAALGAIAPIPCAVVGTNALVLTPAANTPTIGAYNQNHTYCGVASSNNSAATTAQVGSLPALPVYKDTIAGPIALTGLEIITNNAIYLTYDVALNSGNGGFHLQSGTTLLSGGSFSGPITAPAIAIPSSASSVTSILSAAVSLSFASLTPGANSDHSVTISGVSVGDVVAVGLPASVAIGVGYMGFVSIASVAVLRAFNYGPSTVTPTAGSYRLTAIRSVP